MNKIGLIIAREYLSRVKKKSFIIMTFLGPILIGLMYGAAIWLAVNADEMNAKKIVNVIDRTNMFDNTIRNSNTMEFIFSTEGIEKLKADVAKDENAYLLVIPENAVENKFNNVELYSNKQASISAISYIEKELESSLKDKKLVENGISRDILKSLNQNVSIQTMRITEKGEENSSAGASFGIGMLGSILIYLFIFLYGVQVMRGVIEEKNNRIVEVIISSVKPFQLMMGKIVGIALVGLTQFVLWVALTAIISTGISTKIAGDATNIDVNKIEQLSNSGMETSTSGIDNEAVASILEAVNTINFPLLIGSFLFYFLAGYLLYSALFAAIGSAVDSEAETQQFMFPVTLPLIFSFVLSSSAVVNNPDGPIAFWLSMIPLTSPVVMMVRIPFGVPTWQLICSMILLILGFIGTVWIAAKIYRTGILMYGKKVTLKEMVKWLRY